MVAFLQHREQTERERKMEEEEEKRSLESFLKWAAELGISDSPNTPQSPQSSLGHSLTVSYFPDAGGRGLGAVRDLRKGELILRVPKSALITTQTLSFKHHKLSVALNAHPSLSFTQRLTVCLLYEMGRGKSSRWHPYLIHLPRTYDILATFTEFEKQALQVDDAIWATEKAIAKAESEWKEANALMEQLKLKPQLRTFRAWLWASATISSRTLHIPWDEAGCLCPVGDLFNYAAPGEEHVSSLQVISLPNGESTDGLDAEQLDAHLQRLTDGGFEEDVAAYCFYARKSYQKGEQVLLSYGTYTNLELLEHYGFLLNKNPNDKVFIPLESNINCSSSWPKESLYIHEDGKPSFALLCALRLWASPKSQRRSVGHLAYSGSQLSVHNEISVMKWILKNCHVILKNLPSSIEEDSLLLSAIDKIHNSCTALELKMLSALKGEVCSFLEANGLRNGESTAKLLLSKKTKRSIDRWKLAVQWRLRYKKTLVDCNCYCAVIINSLPSQNVFNLENSTRPYLT